MANVKDVVSTNPYNSIGYDNLKEIHRALVKHEIPKEYTHSAIKFKLFGKQNIVNTIDSGQSGHKEYIKKYNEKVRENREMVKHLINRYDNFFVYTRIGISE
jgi:hypothetical protein